MDIITLMRVARRHWLILSAGVLVGLLLVGVTTYRIDPSGNGPLLTRRSFATYTVQSQLVVTDPQFWLGRASGNAQSPDDFNKTVMLATTYANLLRSDAVRQAAEKEVGPTQATLESESVENAPIVQYTLTGSDREQLVRYGSALSAALASYLREEQEARDISKADRMSVAQLSSPTTTTLQSRSWEITLITFLIPVLISYGIALLIDRARYPEEFIPIRIQDPRVV